ncbi:MAG: HD domain-containing protein [Bacteroidetes bacterium]|nr:HD domain-containing protein [Bacteroidota bacterium]MBX7239475.1 HD domain-containing protein [Bacteroidia bacterium]MCC7514257.1 HD domain-containing protein [Bacteroidia bacterium]MCW5919198.1 HD domain-containing protein [Bacteroidota bacterium]HCI57328.1 phosphohydrolase [Bacteroidota bacterium]
MNKKKIINDPVHGFITIPSEFIFDLIEHPYFQRLRRIRQLGLAQYVYPGAVHTRFHHAIGAMHITQIAIETLRNKGHEISATEEEAVSAAILLHDIGHGPFSHALEHTLVAHLKHEEISMMIMEKINESMGGALNMAIEIFKNVYPKKFLHQLVSSQLDMDRLDYLARDSFFTGVSEGIISSERILKMLNVFDDKLVIDAKGIYSVEKFIVARRLMYWQVYLHKTVLAAENQLINTLKRARYLTAKGHDLFGTKSFKIFLKNNFTSKDFKQQPHLIDEFCLLDDFDIFTSIKEWMTHDDFILSHLCKGLIDRNLFKIKLQEKSFTQQETENYLKKAVKAYNITEEEASSLAFTGKIENSAYTKSQENINILFKDNVIKDIADASDNLSISALSKPVVKHYLCVDSGCL